MSGDRDRNGDLWTLPTLKAYFDQRLTDLNSLLAQRIDGVEKAIRVAMTASDKAVDKAEQAQGLRNESQNEFRRSLSDLSGLMWTTKEGTAAIEALRRELTIKLDALEQRITTLSAGAYTASGKSAGVGNFISTLIAIAAVIVVLVIGILDIVFRH